MMTFWPRVIYSGMYLNRSRSWVTYPLLNFIYVDSFGFFDFNSSSIGSSSFSFKLLRSISEKSTDFLENGLIALGVFI